MTISIIVAMAEGGVIGHDGKLIWHLSDDLKRFKRITMGHPLIMGRKTFDSIGKPLPGRKNIVMTRNPTYKSEAHYSLDEFEINTDVYKALGAARKDKTEYFVIGGAEVFEIAAPFANKFYLTVIDKKFEGNVKLAPFDLSEFRKIEDEKHQSPAPDSFSYAYQAWVRK